MNFTFTLIFIFLSFLSLECKKQSIDFKYSQSRVAHRVMVVSADERASEIGVEILRRGGNAIDASVAVGFALAVVFPEAGNIGGGGFMLNRFPNDSDVVVDFRETAPVLANASIFLDSLGNVSNSISTGHRSAGVPGTVAGLILAHRRWGKLPLRDVIAPAVLLADEGFVVNELLATKFEEYKEEFRKYPSTWEVVTQSGEALKKGDIFRQPDLAATLRRIADTQGDDFYKGETARLIIDEMKRGGGLITEKDLADYKPIIRKPLVGSYKGYEIITVPPPSSGGVCLIQLLNLIEQSNLMGRNSANTTHLFVEAMKLVFADRARYLGDPDFVSIPLTDLISKSYAKDLLKRIEFNKAKLSNQVQESNPFQFEGQHTTHFAVIDEEGTISAVTYTINDLFGNKIVVRGAGFFLNNEMDDFSVKPDVANMYGLTGNHRNRVEPNKRPLSSMAPTIVLRDGLPVMILGSRGGPRIITSIFQVVINFIDFSMSPSQAIDSPRFHHQLFPDEIIFERSCFSLSQVRSLTSIGHTLRETNGSIGKVQAIFAYKDSLIGVSDYREGGSPRGY